MTEKNENVIYTRDVDYLDEDKPIRGQNYVCLSFISPEDVIADKEVFYFGNFMKRFSKDMDVMLQALKAKYPDSEDILQGVREAHDYVFDENALQDQYRFFKEVHTSDLDKQFKEKNDFKTSMRGIKVRGVFDTLKEAQNRADFLKKGGDKFDIFVGQVGVWCPWSPNPNDIEDVQYAEAQLNTLMSKYKDNITQKDIFFEQRKHEKMEQARLKLEKSKLENAQVSGVFSTADALEDKDPWLQRKEQQAADASASTSAPAPASESAPADQ